MNGLVVAVYYFLRKMIIFSVTKPLEVLGQFNGNSKLKHLV
jgi:hypothetical protein